jgi:hypothetical protein
MKRFFHLHLITLTMSLLLIGVVQTIAQSVIPIPPHNTIFTGNSRGYWFTAPTDFIITGVRAPIDFSTSAQSVHLVKFTTPPPLYASTTTSFTTLHYVSNLADTGFIPLNILVTTGDVIGVIAVRANATGSSQTSYASSNPVQSMIGTYPVTLQRLGWQGQITNTPAIDFWTETGSSLGRAEIRYAISLPSDGELSSFINLTDSVCSGDNDVTVVLKNNGPNVINQAIIDWEVNGAPQTALNWLGNLAVNDSTPITVGTYTFQTGQTYGIKCYLSDINNDIDSFPLNDTIILAGLGVKPTPTLALNDTILAICQNDTAWISGTLTGTPPWNFTIKEGTTSHHVTGITSSSFNIPMTPSSSRTYTIEGITDATGCETATGPTVTVSVQAAPPATITPMGPPAACMGDSVMLMGSVGVNFGYEWYLNGNMIAGANNYILSAKTGGDYSVKVTSPIGCSNLSAPFTVYIHPLPVVFLGNDTAVLPHQSVLLNAGTGFNSYLWSNGVVSASTLIDSAGTGIGVKTVWVQVTDNNSCKGGDTILINFTPHPSVEGRIAETSIQLFPNPTSGKLTLDMHGFVPGSVTMKVLGIKGDEVHKSEHSIGASEAQIKLDLEHLPTGMYHLITIQNNSKTSNHHEIIILKR